MPGGPAARPEVRVPVVRPFRALRYAADQVDLAAVVAPPYDVIGPELQAELLLRDPRNVVRLDLPPEAHGDDPEERYRRAAKTLAEWRSAGVLRADPRPSFYAYEQTYAVPGGDEVRTQRGFFGRLRLEGYGDGVRPHERTMAGPREDRYRLLRATGVNSSPVVGLFEDQSGRVSERLRDGSELTPTQVVDDAGVQHRLWVVGDSDAIAELSERAGAGALTIADGHHRYETALRYRDERQIGAPAGDPDPAWNYILVLFLDAAHEPLTVLPTHRLVRGLGEGWLGGAREGLGDWFEVENVRRGQDLAAAFSGPTAGERGTLGLWTRDGGLRLTARTAAFDQALGSDPASRLDVSRLGLALDRLCGLTAEALVAGGRVAYTHDATDAIRRVDRRDEGLDAAFLLRPTAVADVLAVAAAGGLMPEKSTYFYPKALTGLVINPHEW